jgi:hypothetical protein
VILFFEHLREEAIDLAGSGGAAAAFFALPNHREAAEATAFIGSDYRWVESQRTRSVSETLTRQDGRETSTARSFTRSIGGSSVGDTETTGVSFSESLGKGSEFSTSEQRVNEALVEPQVLQGLPKSGLMYVEMGDGGRRRVASVDVNPVLALAPRVSEQPHVGTSALPWRQ